MRQSLKEIIDGLAAPADKGKRYLADTTKFIEEAKKGQNWSLWNQDVFEQFFEKNHNCIAKLGKGQMNRAEKNAIKSHWSELAPHLKIIAENQDTPLWDEYKEIRRLICKITHKNLNVATNRILAGLQPKLFCTECDITRINKLVDYLRRNTDGVLTDYNPVNWERASYSLQNLFKTITGTEEYWTLSHVSYTLLSECERRYGVLPKKWLVYANRTMWHHAEALHEIGFISWTMYRTNFSIGDEVYLFMSDERRIRFKTRVVADNCERGDEAYRVDRKNSTHLTYKLEFVSESLSDELKEQILLKHGFNGGRSIQSPLYNNPELFEYIAPFFESDNIPEDDEIPNPETVYEGAKKEIIVNSYERNHEARNRCIAAHGCKCSVCGMDFEKVYGEIGRGFIHVHHIVPISSIGKEYELDPIKDLIPVCPNCHAMLHKKNPPYDIEDLKLWMKQGGSED